jgi:hypothetical protein
MTPYSGDGRHDLGSPVAPRITGDRTRSRLPWGLLLVLELCGRPTRCLCDRLLGQRDSHNPGFG